MKTVVYRWDGSPLTPTEANRKIREFSFTYGPRSLLLAAHLAVVEQLRADIVSLVRINFLPRRYRHDVTLDADVLFGSLSYDLGGGLFKMDRQVRRYLMNKLNAWHVDRTGSVEESRVSQVARFVRAYASRKRALPTVDKAEREYLNRIDWVALAYYQPDSAAKSLAEEMIDASKSNKISADYLKFSRVRPLIELPIASYVSVLNYARMIEAISLEDYERAARFASGVSDGEVDVCGVDLPAPDSVVTRYKKFAMYRESYRIATGERGVGDGTHVEPASASPQLPDQPARTGAASLDVPETALHRAVINGDMSRVKQLLAKEKQLINKLNPDAKSALHLAVERNLEEVVKLLCRNNAMVDAGDGNNSTPLLYAAENGHTAIAELLLSCGAALSHLNSKGEGFLHGCARHGHLPLVDLYIAKKGDVNRHAGEALPPFFLALIGGRYEIVERLLRNGARIDFLARNQTGALAYACIGGNPRVVALLLEFGCYAGAKNRSQHTPIMFAAYHGKTEAFNHLLKAGERFDQATDIGQTPLHLCAEAGHLDLLKQILSLYPAVDEIIDAPYVVNGFQWTPLRLAALRGHYAVVRYLVDQGCDFKSWVNGWSLLHLCSQGSAQEDGSIDPDFDGLIRYLLKQGLQINSKIDGGKTALHIAVWHDAEDIVSTLGSQPSIDVNVKDSDGMTPLLYGAANGKAGGVTALLQLPGVDFDAQLDNGKKVLALAVEAKSLPTVSALLASSQIDRNHSYDDKVESRPIWLAANTDQWDIFRELWADPMVSVDDRSEENSTLLHKVIAKKCPLEIVDAVLARGFDIDVFDKKEITPLILAIRQERVALLKYCLGAGASLRRHLVTNTTSPLEEAVKTGSLVSLRILCDAGADVEERNLDSQTLLHVAAGTKGGAGIVEFLIGRGLSIESRDNRQRTPLHEAIELGDAGTIELIAKNGGDWNVQDENGLAAVHLAIRSGHVQLVTKLIEMGADISLTTNDGWTALHFVALYDQAGIVDLLVQEAPGLLNHVADSPQATPLQVAAEIGAEKVCRLLAEYDDIDIDFENEDRLPAVFLAAKNGHTAIVDYLLAIGASDFTSSTAGTIDLTEIQAQRKSKEELIAKRPPKTETPGKDDGSDAAAKKTRMPPKKQSRDTSGDRATQRPGRGGRAREWLWEPLAHTQFANPDDEVSHPWRVVTGKTRGDFLEKIDPIDGKLRVTGNSTQLLRTSPPFYKNVELLRVRNARWKNPRRCIYFLRRSDTQEVFRLNGTSTPIHAVNAKAPITLHPDNVVSYVRFYGFFVRGEEGPFYILEDGNDTSLANVKGLDETTKSVIEGTVRPAHFAGMNAEGQFLVDAVISYSNALFVANYVVHETGNVEMLDDEPIAGDLLTRIDAPIA